MADSASREIPDLQEKVMIPVGRWDNHSAVSGLRHQPVWDRLTAQLLLRSSIPTWRISQCPVPIPAQNTDLIVVNF